MINVVSLIMGFVLLVWGADRFVEGSSELARKLGIPSIIIGLTVVAFGTSAPELAVSVVAGIQGANEIVIGNVLGSNIFNLLVVVGFSAVVSPLVIEKELLERDWIASILATILLAGLMVLGNGLSRGDAVVLLLAFTVVIGVQIKSAMKEKKILKIENNTNEAQSDKKIIFYIFAGLISIVLGGQLAVNGATEIVRVFHISETVIGLTIVAIGTSLPELVTSVVATKRGEKSIAIGNVIGSNLFNVLFILGLSALCNPIMIQMTAIYDVVILFAISIIMYVIGRKWHFNRGIGLTMIVIYIGYTMWIVMR